MSENKAREIWNRVALDLADYLSEMTTSLSPTEVKAFLWHEMHTYTDPAASDDEAKAAADSLAVIFLFCAERGVVSREDFSAADPYNVDLGDNDYSWAKDKCKDTLAHLNQQTTEKWRRVGEAASGIMAPPDDPKYANFPSFDREGLMWLFIRAYTQPERKEIDLSEGALAQMLGGLVQESLNVDAGVAAGYINYLDTIKLGEREHALADCTLQQWKSKIPQTGDFPGTDIRQPLAEG